MNEKLPEMREEHREEIAGAATDAQRQLRDFEVRVGSNSEGEGYYFKRAEGIIRCDWLQHTYSQPSNNQGEVSRPSAPVLGHNHPI